MERFSVTVRNESSGATFHTASVLARLIPHAGFVASSVPLEDWLPGSAPIEFYQVDPELDSLSYGHFATLDEAQKAGLAWYRQHRLARGSRVGDCKYEQYPVRADDPALETWHIVDSANIARSSHITMCQIVKCELWTSAAQALDSATEGSGVEPPRCTDPRCIDPASPHISHGDH